jgi:branched-chain amino acid transport system permease protein
MGFLIERLTLRPLIGQSVLAIIMMTIALSTVLEALAGLIWGGEYKTYHGVLPSISLKLGGISLPSESLIGLIVAVIIVVLLLVFFRYTKMGLAMMATSEDEQVAQSSGIKVTFVYALSWMIACIVGVIGGILLGGVSGVMVSLSEVGLKAFAVVLLGGVNSIGGAILAGVILGVSENVAAGYLDPLLPGGGLANVFPFLLMIVVLIIRPYGLFGQKRIERI